MSESLAAALVAAQSKMPAVAKDSVNPHYRSKYVSLDALIAMTRPILNAAGLVITQDPTVTEAGEPALTTTLIHVSGEERSSTMVLIPGRDDMQGLGSAITYARRYAWASMLGIASEEDTDGNIPGAPAPARAEPKPRTAERPPMAARQPRSETRMATGPQIRKMGDLAKALDEAVSPIPADYAGANNWVEVLKMRLVGEYQVEHRNELRARQAEELIAWLDAQAIPF